MIRPRGEHSRKRALLAASLVFLGACGSRRADRETRPYLERFLREAPEPLYGRDFPKVRAWLSAAPPA
jgi:hypothetical protein